MWDLKVIKICKILKIFLTAASINFIDNFHFYFAFYSRKQCCDSFYFQFIELSACRERPIDSALSICWSIHPFICDVDFSGWGHYFFLIFCLKLGIDKHKKVRKQTLKEKFLSYSKWHKWWIFGLKINTSSVFWICSLGIYIIKNYTWWQRKMGNWFKCYNLWFIVTL